jgi:hypothetical protein
MNNFPIFHKSLYSSTASKVKTELWDSTLAAYDEKQYLKSFHLLMDYVNPELRAKYGNADGTVFKVPHGSVIVNVAINNETFSVSAPFLEVNQDAIVPLLRQVCTLNFSSLDLAQIYLRENHLDFEYSCKINETNPYKIYYILREICDIGDKYDDEFVTSFGAKRLYEPIVIPFSADKAEKAYQTIQTIIKQALDYTVYFESKRNYSQAWDFIAGALRQIDFYVHPQGQLKNNLDGAIRDANAEAPLPGLITNMKNFLQGWQTMDKAKLIEDLYEIEIFIPTKRRSSLQNVQENLQKLYERAEKGIQDGYQSAVAVDILFNFYNVYYHNNLQEDINVVLVDALEKSSEKPWEEAANVLFRALKKIMDGDLSTAPAKKGGLFSRLTGK